MSSPTKTFESNNENQSNIDLFPKGNENSPFIG